MTSRLAEGDSYGPQRGEESYGISVGYQAWGMPRGGQWQQPPQGAGANGEGELSAGGATSSARTSYVAGAAPNMHARVAGNTSTNYYSKPPAANMVGGLSQSIPLDAAFSSHDGHRLHVHDSEINVPEPSQVVADLGEDMDKHDAGMDDTWAGASADIAGTQSTGNVTVDLTDDGKTDDTAGGHVRKKGKRARGGGHGGDDAGKAKVRGPDWSSAESVTLLKLLFEEDCMQQNRQATNEKQEGQAAGLPLTFEREFYEALQWKLAKADGHYDRLMQSVNMEGGSSSTDMDDEDMGGGEDTGGVRRKADNDSGAAAKFTRSGGRRGHLRRSSSESSVEGGRGGTFADVAHALVDATDRQTDKLPGSFVDAMARINMTMADGNNTLLLCFAMLSDSLAGQPASAPATTHGGISSGARTTSVTGMSSSPLRNVTKVVDMAGDFALTHRRMIEQAHELARKRGVIFICLSAMVKELKCLREQVDKASMREGVALSKAEVAETTIAVLRDEV
ncbi:hypothetical protein CBR_g31028 [Chara braunii]|uniref:Uncharacterized protein n=1 Tax=Chara braunii TaxID=69332 RepID=A0A388LE40_CHABU|nr:hypothetical protein CBR_g31028 [Chara braunii]|eukprot:GBG80568.1 hypothetical protein CBR_g31028 [Chara braunii]